MTMLQGKIVLVLVTGAVLTCFLAGTAAAQQAAPAYDQSIAGVCRSYASGVQGVSPEVGFDLCMRERGCSVVPGTAQYQCEGYGQEPRHGGGGGIEGG